MENLCIEQFKILLLINLTAIFMLSNKPIVIISYRKGFK